MYDTILLPTDGSEGTETTLEHAIEVAQHSDAVLRVLYVVNKRLAFATEKDRRPEVFEELDMGTDPKMPAKFLSHGDKKKLEIGMSLLTDPSLLLLDEPTSGISHEESGQMIEYLERVTAELTVVLIEHDVDLVLQLADRITVLHQGRIIATGSPDGITEMEAVQRAYLGDRE